MDTVNVTMPYQVVHKTLNLCRVYHGFANSIFEIAVCNPRAKGKYIVANVDNSPSLLACSTFCRYLNSDIQIEQRFIHGKSVLKITIR